MYCSRSVSIHLLRGVLALGLIVSAIFANRFGLIWSGLAVLGAVVLLRGCPMCWLVGLFETLKRGKAAKAVPARNS